MDERHSERRKDRHRQNLIWNRDVENDDRRHPDEVEDGNRDPDRFRAEPVEPAKTEFALLLTRQAARTGQQVPPMLFQNLEAAIGPAVALLLEGFECVGQQAVPVTPIGVVDLPSTLQNAEPKISI